MNYTPERLRMALTDRLPKIAEQRGVSLARLRKELVFELLLARLITVAPDSWVLKGGLALDFRLGAAARTTRDMDLGRSDDEVAAERDFLAATRVETQDHFEFEVERTGRLDNVADGQATRYRVVASLAGREFDSVIIDVGFGDPMTKPDPVPTPGLLQFAGIAPVTVPTFPVAQHVAEKVHAYTRAYAGGSSSRVKDLVDLVLLARLRPIDAAGLKQALQATFRTRYTHSLPASLPAPPITWADPYRRMADQVAIAADLDCAHRITSAFLDPVLSGDVREGTWSSEEQRWVGASDK